MTPSIITALYDGQAFHCECWCLSHYSSKIKQLILAGPLREVRSITAGLAEDSRFYVGGNTKEQFFPDDHGYRVVDSKVMAKDFVVVQVRSYCPRSLWGYSSKELFTALMTRPFETPLLQRWMKAFHVALESRQLIVPLRGFNPLGKFLSLELSPKKLDELTSKGVSEKKLNLR